MSVNFQEVKAKFDILKVCELLGLEVKRQANGQLRSACPICKSKGQRDMVITPEKGLAYCFKGCGGGDQLWLIAKVRECSPKEAAEWLVGGTGKEPAKREPVKGCPVLDYLDPEHEAVEAVGFDAETAKALGIGYSPKGIMKGFVAVPIRLPTGELTGYIGIQEAKLPKEFHFPKTNIIPLKKKG